MEEITQFHHKISSYICEIVSIDAQQLDTFGILISVFGIFRKSNENMQFIQNFIIEGELEEGKQVFFINNDTLRLIPFQSDIKFPEKMTTQNKVEQNIGTIKEVISSSVNQNEYKIEKVMESDQDNTKNNSPNKIGTKTLPLEKYQAKRENKKNKVLFEKKKIPEQDIEKNSKFNPESDKSKSQNPKSDNVKTQNKSWASHVSGNKNGQKLEISQNGSYKRRSNLETSEISDSNNNSQDFSFSIFVIHESSIEDHQLKSAFSQFGQVTNIIKNGYGKSSVFFSIKGSTENEFFNRLKNSDISILGSRIKIEKSQRYSTHRTYNQHSERNNDSYK